MRRLSLAVVGLVGAFGCGEGQFEGQLGGVPPDEAVESELSEGFPVVATVTNPPVDKLISRDLFGLNLIATAATSKDAFYAQYGNGATTAEKVEDGRRRLKAMNIRFIRFPGGCHGDGWNARTGEMKFTIRGRDVTWQGMSVADFQSLAQELGATALLQLNVETKGLSNPCGWIPRYPDPGLSEAQKTAQLLDDARWLARNFYFRHYEVGNEPWGAWDPSQYSQVALTFARELKAINRYLQVHLVGHPTTGNNQDPTAPPNGKDALWTQVVKNVLQDQSCTGGKCFAYATDHPYVFMGYNPMATNYSTNFPGMDGYWAHTNGWVYDQRVADYSGSKVSLTEWNIKCWSQGALGDFPVGITNPGFDESATIAPFGFWQKHPSTGSAVIATDQKKNGTQSVKVSLTRSSGDSSDLAQVQQRFPTTPGNRMRARVWVRSATPVNAALVLQQSNPGAHQWHHVAETTGATVTPNTWTQLSIEGLNFADTTELQVVLRTQKSLAQWQADPTAAVVYFDLVEVTDLTYYLSLANPSFEEGVTGWGLWQKNPNTGSRATVTTEAQSGTQSMRVQLLRNGNNGTDLVQVSQALATHPGRKVRLTAYVKTATPGYAQLIIQQTNPGAHQWHHVVESTLSSSKPNTWQGVTVMGTTFDDTTSVQAVLRIAKTAAQWQADPNPVTVYWDTVALSDVTGWYPAVPSVSTAEHGMFTFEALLRMAKAGVSAANYHAFARGHCGVAKVDSGVVSLNPQGQAFALASVLGDGRLLNVSTSSPTWTLPTHTCTSPSCLPSGVEVPYVSVYSARSGDDNAVHVFVVNRHPTYGTNTTVTFSGVDLTAKRRLVRTVLRADDYTSPTFIEESSTQLLSTVNPLPVYAPPRSIVRMTLSFEKTYTITARAECADGSLSTQASSAFHALWPNPTPGLTWQQTAIAPGVKTVTIVSSHRWNSVYVGMTGPGSWDQPLEPKPPPNALMTASTFFNPPTWMVRWAARELPSGSYTLRYKAAGGCP